MRWSELEAGDTVEIGAALMTVMRVEGFVYTWLNLGQGTSFDVDYKHVSNLNSEIESEAPGACRFVAHARTRRVIEIG